MQPGTIGKSGLAWPCFPNPGPFHLPGPKKQPRDCLGEEPLRVQMAQHLLGFHTLCRLSSPLATLTGGLSLFCRGDGR